jgi:ABC-type transport system involved in multi-copper enzyme maturation permease subunit
MLRLRSIQMFAMTKFVTQQAAFERYFYGLALTAILGLGLSVVLSNLAIAGQIEVLTHMTLSLAELFGLLVVLTMAPRLIIDAMTNRQVYLLFSRPMPRWVFVVGTYLGLFVFIGLCTLALGGVSTFLRFTQGGEIHTAWYGALGTIFLSLMTLASAAMFFSTFSSKLLSAFFTFGIYMGGNGLSLLLQYAERQEGLSRLLLTATAKFLPNLETINLKMAAVYNLEWTTPAVGTAAINCLVWQAMFVLAAVVIFEKRNLK